MHAEQLQFSPRALVESPPRVLAARRFPNARRYAAAFGAGLALGIVWTIVALLCIR